jgi:glycosyltransferase involved in cell wall biosynthesis
MTEPAFTVITKAYNEEEFVAAAIRSALAQTRGDFELVVVNDGSTDGTAAVVEGLCGEDPRVRLINQPNLGVSAALNTGVAAGTAPYVALLDADDLWMPTYLERIGEALDSDPRAGFAFTDGWRLHQDSGRLFRASYMQARGGPQPPPQEPHELLRELMRTNFVLSLATLRRSAIVEAGGFDTDLSGAEDYDMWIRVLAAGFTAAWVPGRLTVRRDRGGSESKDERGMLTNLRKICGTVAAELDVPEDVKQVARDRAARLDRHLRALGGGSSATAAWWGVRRRLGKLRKRLMANRIWYPETPAEVSAAFPDLGRER